VEQRHRVVEPVTGRGPTRRGELHGAERFSRGATVVLVLCARRDGRREDREAHSNGEAAGQRFH
jgi:hypothetical protein